MHAPTCKVDSKHKKQRTFTVYQVKKQTTSSNNLPEQESTQSSTLQSAKKATMSMFQSQAAGQTLFCATIITALLCCLSTLTVEGAPVATSPEFKLDKPVVTVNLNTIANFTCTLPCEFDNSHDIKWLFGTGEGIFRKVSILILTKTIDASVDTVESCRSGGSADIQTLRVNATSLDLDKSPVQCFGSPKTSDYENIYTEYSVLRVTDPSPVVPTPADCQQTTQEQTTDEKPASSSTEGGTPDTLRITTGSGSILSPALLLTILGLIAQYLCS